MANIRLSAANKQALANALITAAGSGAKIVYLKGTMPASTDTAYSAGDVMVKQTITGALGTASGGVITVSGLPANVAVTTAGTLTCIRVETSAGVALWDGTAGTSGAVINGASLAFGVGDKINLESLTFTVID